jgi:hypothetical protein
MKNYLPLKQKSYQLADEYYKCVQENLIRSEKRSLRECLAAGRKYRAALRKQLKDLQRIGDPRFVEHERKLLTDYLNLIERDLADLSHGEIPRIKSRTSLDH